jgi:hypothetical protein
MPYQKCPICLGTGVDHSSLDSSCSRPCPTCKGTRIINTISGLPPSESEKPKNQDSWPTWFPNFDGLKKKLEGK